jgi:tetratricopeptide (TPR) repeat protein
MHVTHVTHVAIARGALALFGAALLIVGIHAAAVRGLADVHCTNARLVLSAAAQANRPPEAGELAEARVSLREALRFEPSNPLFVEQFARTEEIAAALAQSLAGWREAARMRPGSPYAWASIALLKLRLGQMDAEFYGALERAAQLGPWEPPVQIAIADAGLAAWRRLTPPAKTLVIAALERALLRQEPELRRIAAAHGTLTLVCAGDALPPRLAAFCVKK